MPLFQLFPSALQVHSQFFRNGVCGNESESETQSSFQIGRGFHLDDQCGFLPIFTAPAGRGKTAVINLRFAEYTRSLVVRSSYAPNGIAGLRERDGFRVGVKRTSVNSIFSTVGRLRIAQEEIGNRRDGIDRFRSARVISCCEKGISVRLLISSSSKTMRPVRTVCPSLVSIERLTDAFPMPETISADAQSNGSSSASSTETCQ